MAMRPKHLAIELSKLQPHPCTSVELEQYATEGDLAAYWILGIDQVDEMEGGVSFSARDFDPRQFDPRNFVISQNVNPQRPTNFRVGDRGVIQFHSVERCKELYQRQLTLESKRH